MSLRTAAGRLFPPTCSRLNIAATIAVRQPGQLTCQVADHPILRWPAQCPVHEAIRPAGQAGASLDARNVCSLVDAPSADRHEVQPFTAAEARAVLAAAQGTRGAARWSVALALGLRQGEALGLAWSDVHLDAATLTVRQALQRVQGQGLVLVPPKSRAGRRTIAVPAQLVAALRAHRTAQVAERLHAGELWETGASCSASPTVGPSTHARTGGAWKALLCTAGVRDARLHDARHTAATLLLQQGVPARGPGVSAGQAWSRLSESNR
ncbi:MAG: site-specific integrase [Nocardioidaceae bacterium]